MVRLVRLLGWLLIPADVVIISEQHAWKWAAVKGTMIHDAMSEGWSDLPDRREQIDHYEQIELA